MCRPDELLLCSKAWEYSKNFSRPSVIPMEIISAIFITVKSLCFEALDIP